MGRKAGKTKVALIEDQKTRNKMFKQRKECLMKKIKELSTLCDVKACMVLFSPDHGGPTAIWPPTDPALVDQLIRVQNPNSKNGDDDESQLGFRLGEIAQKAQFGDFVGKKIERVRAQIDRLKSDQQRVADQFASTAMVTPPGGNRDDDGKAPLIRQCAVDELDAQQQQLEFLGCSSSSTLVIADQSCCSSGTVAGFDGASCSTQLATTAAVGDDDDDDDDDDVVAQPMMWQSTGDDDVAPVQDNNFYNQDDADFVEHFYTLPMMSTDDHNKSTQFQENGADECWKCIDFDGLWV